MIVPGDIDALCLKLETLIKEPDVRKKFSNESYLFIINNLSLNSNIEKLKSYYQALIH